MAVKRSDLTKVQQQKLDKYNSFISTIDKKNIDAVCKLISKNFAFEDTAVVLTGIQRIAWTRAKTNTKHPFHAYLNNSIKKAEAQKEQALITIMLDKTNLNATQSRIVQQYLEVTNAKFSKKLALQYKYDLQIFFDVLKNYVDKETLKTILLDISRIDPYQIVEQLDKKYLLE